MNSFLIREVLMKVRNEIKCPKCQGFASPANISIEMKESEGLCQFSVECAHCEAEFGGLVQMKESLTPLGKKMNASSRKSLQIESEKEFSHNECTSLKDSLHSVSSLSDMFPSKN